MQLGLTLYANRILDPGGMLQPQTPYKPSLACVVIQAEEHFLALMVFSILANSSGQIKCHSDPGCLALRLVCTALLVRFPYNQHTSLLSGHQFLAALKPTALRIYCPRSRNWNCKCELRKQPLNEDQRHFPDVLTLHIPGTNVQRNLRAVCRGYAVVLDC